jgi:hypothetical protein
MKAGKCLETGRVWLRELSQRVAEAFARSQSNEEPIPDNVFAATSEDDECIANDIEHQEHDECWSDGDNLDTESISIASISDQQSADTSHEVPERFFCQNKAKTIGIAFEATKDIPPDLLPETYSLINILERTQPPPLIAWETARRPAKNVLYEPKEGEAPLSKDQIIQQLKQNLDIVKEFSNDHEIWEQLNKLTEENVQYFYQKLVDSFATANQYIASYNPAVSYCTGAHNNAVLLGGDQQAKAATFYLCPYMGKLKFPLQDCLVILQQALDYVKKFPSTVIARDNLTGDAREKRESTHVFHRCLNRLNLQMELSGTTFIGSNI